MKKTPFKCIITFAFALTLCVQGWSDESDSSEVLNAFVAHIETLKSIEADVKAEALEAVDSLREDAYTHADAITEGLMKLYPHYAKAVAATQGDDAPEAIALLESYQQSEDKFLAADASFYAARTMLNSEQFESALPLLDALTGDLNEFTVHAGNSQYFTAVAQANLLQNREAVDSFSKFLQQNPDAPERMRVAAWRQIQLISQIRDGQLEDVHQRMDFSRRRLEQVKTGEPTQVQQRKIVDMLAKLIKEQEKKECSSCNSKKNCKGNKEGQAKKPGKKSDQKTAGKSQSGGSSSNPNGTARRSYSDGPASPWSKLRERSRDPAYSAIKDQMPAKYREIVERYTEKAQGTESDGAE